MVLLNNISKPIIILTPLPSIFYLFHDKAYRVQLVTEEAKRKSEEQAAKEEEEAVQDRRQRRRGRRLSERWCLDKMSHIDWNVVQI